MQSKYIVGIDGGSQSTKVIIFDLEGNIVSQGQCALQAMQRTKPGMAEHPDDDLWDSLLTASKQAMSTFPHNPKSIIGVGLCTIRCCRALLDERGKLVSPVMSWMDTRLSEQFQDTGLDVSYVTTSSGYITHRLTGEFRDTASNYEGQWPIDKDTWQWSNDPILYKECNIQRERLFELVKPGEVLGSLSRQASAQTMLPIGLPVIATANDKAVEALGAGLVPSGQKANQELLISLGTYITAMLYGDRNMTEVEHFFSNMAAIPDCYLFESQGIRYGMGMVSWLKDIVSGEIPQGNGKPLEQILNMEASDLPAGSDGLISLPDWLAPNDKQHKRGVMLGFHAGHTRAHIYRSLLESIAMSMKNNVDNMLDELKLRGASLAVKELKISGGGSKSDLMMQVMADVFGLPCCRNRVEDAAALGSAISVGVALGVFDNYGSASQSMVKPADTFKPIDANVQLYKRINSEVFQGLAAANDKLLLNVHSIFRDS